MDITRRKSLQGAAAAAAAAMAPSNNELGTPRRNEINGRTGIEFATMNGFRPDHKSRGRSQISPRKTS